MQGKKGKVLPLCVNLSHSAFTCDHFHKPLFRDSLEVCTLSISGLQHDSSFLLPSGAEAT